MGWWNLGEFLLGLQLAAKWDVSLATLIPSLRTRLLMREELVPRCKIPTFTTFS